MSVYILITFIIIYFSAGAGIYVEHSQFISNSAVANNTAVRLTSVDCENCRLSFYCLSNSTTNTSKAILQYPSGRKFPTQELYSLRVNWVNSSGFYAHNNGRYIPGQGIYTCEMPDSNGNLLMLSIGVYHDSLRTDSHYYIKYNYYVLLFSGFSHYHDCSNFHRIPISI